MSALKPRTSVSESCFTALVSRSVRENNAKHHACLEVATSHVTHLHPHVETAPSIAGCDRLGGLSAWTVNVDTPRCPRSAGPPYGSCWSP